MVKFLSFIGVFLVSTAFGQTFRNIRVLKEEEKIIITYDLIYEEPGSKVVVLMYGSLDNFVKPITNATGNIGEVSPGPNRRVEWDIKNLPAGFTGTPTFQFKGEIIHGWKFVNPKNGTLRRGKKYTLRWAGGMSYDTINLKFISPGNVITEIATVKNTGNYQWRVPKKTETGIGYVLRLTKEKEVFEQQILIRRKTPIALVAIPLVGVAVFLGIGDSDSEGPTELPDAPKPN
jgi:hypothetical protein